MPQNELVEAGAQAICQVYMRDEPKQSPDWWAEMDDAEKEQFREMFCAALKAHSEWLAERVPQISEAIRLALEIDDNAPQCLNDLCRFGPCACCEVAAKAVISAALAEE